MIDEIIKTKQVLKQPMLRASVELWEKFGEWMRVQGCQTLSEGIRTAMRQVTENSNRNQEGITKN